MMKNIIIYNAKTPSTMAGTYSETYSGPDIEPMINISMNIFQNGSWSVTKSGTTTNTGVWENYAATPTSGQYDVRITIASPDMLSGIYHGWGASFTDGPTISHGSPYDSGWISINGTKTLNLGGGGGGPMGAYGPYTATLAATIYFRDSASSVNGIESTVSANFTLTGTMSFTI